MVEIGTYEPVVQALYARIQSDPSGREMAAVAFGAYAGPGAVPARCLSDLDLALYLARQGVDWHEVCRINT